MKEDLELSLDVALKLRRCLNYIVQVSKEKVLEGSLSDELCAVMILGIESLKTLDIILDEAICVLNERIRIFGSEGLETEDWSDYDE